MSSWLNLAILWFVAVTAANGQYCCRKCYQTCLNFFDILPSTTYNDMSIYLRNLKAQREASNAQSTNYMIDSSVPGFPGGIVWFMQRHLAAATTHVLIENQGTCAPTTLVQYGNNIAWAWSSNQGLDMCRAASRIRGMPFMWDSYYNDFLRGACYLTDLIVPGFATTVDELGMALAFTNSVDQNNGLQCSPFDPKIATRVHHGYVTPIPPFDNHSKHWWPYFWPSLLMDVCLDFFCCRSRSAAAAAAAERDDGQITWATVNPRTNETETSGGSLTEMQQKTGVRFGTMKVSNRDKSMLKKMYEEDIGMIREGLANAREMGMEMEGWAPPAFEEVF